MIDDLKGFTDDNGKYWPSYAEEHGVATQEYSFVIKSTDKDTRITLHTDEIGRISATAEEFIPDS